MTTTFSQAIRERREELGLRQKDVAEACGFSIPYLSDMEQGRRKAPPDGRIYSLASILNLPVEFLLFFARRLPDLLPYREYEPKEIVEAYYAFMDKLKKHDV